MRIAEDSLNDMKAATTPRLKPQKGDMKENEGKKVQNTPGGDMEMTQFFNGSNPRRRGKDSQKERRTMEKNTANPDSRGRFNLKKGLHNCSFLSNSWTCRALGHTGSVGSHAVFDSTRMSRG